MGQGFRPIIMSSTFLTIAALLLKAAKSQDVISLINSAHLHSNCSGSGKFEQGSKYETNLNHLLSNLTSKSSSEKFYNFTVGTNPNKVYGLYNCFFSIDDQLCQRCVQSAQNEILKSCASSVEAIVWYQFCMLRYAKRFIFSTIDISKHHLVKKGPIKYGQYNQQLSHKLIDLFSEATSGCSQLVSATSISLLQDNLTLALQVECTPDLSKPNCRSCLQTALSRYDTQGHRGAILLQPSCVISSFFADEDESLPPAAPNNKKFYVGMGVTSGIATIALILNVILISCLKKRKVITKKPTGVEEIESMESLRIELDTIKYATGNFSEDSKLGQGGFGIVYMGTLGDGEVVAVKRLSSASRQAVREFKTVACLAAKLQHNNLVKVYGYCSERDEMLLVYEYVPNSLDRLLFERVAYLKWETRYKIIVGIARGLMYLHEDSIPKIIHGDLKPSNILLDDYMNPKIADFGMAKLFGEDQSEGNSSRLVGTIGYMAPEYITSGHISVKSDIFSYGVILLEIVSGLRNWRLDPDVQEENLLSFAWNLWNKGKYFDLIDKTLPNDISKIDTKRCIHVGLLCTQGDPSKRPSMANILIMLDIDLNVELPSPSSPSIFSYQQNR